MGKINELLTYKEVQDYLKVSNASVIRAINNKDNPLKVTYLGDKSPRIKLEDLTAWIEKQNETYNTNPKCAFCYFVINFADFKDGLSKKEFTISGLCQSCQDRAFERLDQ